MNAEYNIYLANQVLCQPDWAWESDTNGWCGYHIWYVDSGEAKIIVQNEEYTLFPGDTFLFDLKQNHICSHTPENPLMVSTIYFQGPPIIYKTRVIRQTQLLAETVHRILDCVEDQNLCAARIWLRALITSFTDFKKKLLISSTVKKSCLFLENHLSDSVSLDRLSKYTGYSKNQLLRLFQKELGCTPMQYYLSKKISYAKNQLVYSKQPIRVISDALGFCDESYFSKVFKAQVGCSPKEFRYQTSQIGTADCKYGIRPGMDNARGMPL